MEVLQFTSDEKKKFGQLDTILDQKKYIRILAWMLKLGEIDTILSSSSHSLSNL
jgi:hypothetical protein